MTAALRCWWGLPELHPERLFFQPGEPAPGRYVVLELGDALRPSWLSRGEPLPLWLCRKRGSGPRGGALATFVDAGESWPAVVESEGRITFTFDPDEVVAALQNESYFESRRPPHTYLSLPYQVVPGEARLRLFRWLVKPSAADATSGPHQAAVDALRWAFRAAWGRAYTAEPSAPPRWPHGKRAAFVVSHDVDTARGLGLVADVASFEADLGLRSTWFVVGCLFDRHPAVLDRLRAQGHEVGLHGDVHDNTIAYQHPDRIERRLDRCRDWIARHGVRGFRSPSLLETPALRAALRTRFHYASQVPDTEAHSLVAPRRGCATSCPFRRGGLLEIPITLPMEDKLIMQGMDEDLIFDTWRRKAAAVTAAGGVLQLAMHNEPHLLRRARGAYERLVRVLREDASLWPATLHEIADHWTAGEAHGAA